MKRTVERGERLMDRFEQGRSKKGRMVEAILPFLLERKPFDWAKSGC